jgi:hypothetical protein
MGQAMAKAFEIALTGTVLAIGLGCGGPVSTSGTDAKSFSGQGTFANRLEAARAISDLDQRDKALANVAKDAAKAGEGETVKEALKGIRFLDLRDNTAAKCALNLNERGQGAAAVEVAKSIAFIDKRNEVLSELAKGSK